MALMQMTLWPDMPRQRWRSRHDRCRCRAHDRADARGRHSNSLAAYDDQRLQAEMTGRRAMIVAWLREHGPATDREIVAGLYHDGADPNLVRPRVSELLDAGAIVETGHVRDHATGMKVRRVDVTGIVPRSRT